MQVLFYCSKYFKKTSKISKVKIQKRQIEIIETYPLFYKKKLDFFLIIPSHLYNKLSPISFILYRNLFKTNPMNTTLKTLALFLCLSMCKQNIKAQDIHFSQIFETPILRNPSLAGLYNGDVRIQTVHRNQWNSVTDAYQTTSVSCDYKQHVGNGDDFISFGGQVVYDKAGTVALTTTQILPAINYNKSMSDFKNVYLSLGFMGGIIQRRLDRSKMTTNNQYDGTGYNGALADGETFSSNGYSYFDGSVGMSLNSQLGNNENNNFYVGLAYHHFNQSKKASFYNSGSQSMTPRWVLSSGLRYEMTNNSYFTLQADYNRQGTYQEIVGGAIYSMKIGQNEDARYFFHCGTYMRWRDAIIPVAKIEFQPLAVAISYDANISALKTSSKGRGGFEISLSYQKFRKNNSSLDAVRCPKF
jgi:type IX secretion system PorP/SprF family membrane protein